MRDGLKEGFSKAIHGVSAADLERLIEKMMPSPRSPAPETPQPPKAAPSPPPKTLRDFMDMPLAQPLG